MTTFTTEACRALGTKVLYRLTLNDDQPMYEGFLIGNVVYTPTRDHPDYCIDAGSVIVIRSEKEKALSA